MGTLLPNAVQTFTGPNGTPLSGGSVYFYIPGTTTPKNTYQDPAQTILNTDPVLLNANGQAIIWGTGSYRQVVYDANNNLIWDQVTEDTSGGLIGNMTDQRFVAGTDYTPGTTTQLTLSAGPGSQGNLWVYFDGVYQADDQYTISGTTLTFNSPIPVGAQEVNCKIGSTIAIGTPGAGTVTDSSVATNAAIQSTKLSYIQGGASSVARTVQSKFQEFVSVKDFGAVGDGNADDTAAIQSAITWCQSNSWCQLRVPPGIYKITSTLSITAPIKLIGYGNGFEANGLFPLSTISKFLWNGNSTTPMVEFAGVNFGGFGIEGLELDANNIALKCLVIDGCVGGKFDDVTCRNYTGSNSIGCHLTSSTTNTCSWNVFTNMNMDCVNGGNAAIRLSGFVGLGNACHNTFINTRISHGANSNAIALGGCDNNVFLMTFIYRQPGSTAYGVVADTSEQAGFPVANVFFHLEAGTGGYYQPNGSSPYNAAQIYGYQLDNGQPEPYLPNGGAFGFTNAGQMFGAFSLGKSVGNNLAFSSSIASGSSSATVNFPTTEPDANYNVILTPGSDPGVRWWISAKSASGFTVSFSGATTGTFFFDVTLIRH